MEELKEMEEGKRVECIMYWINFMGKKLNMKMIMLLFFLLIMMMCLKEVVSRLRVKCVCLDWV